MYSMVIADDELNICSAIQNVVEFSFPQIQIVGIFQNGEELKQFITSNAVDIIITDVEMPLVSGLEISGFVESHGHKSYLIMITAYREFEYVQQALENRVDSFLLKPYTTKRLEDEIRKGINRVALRKKASMENWPLYRSLIKAWAESNVLEHATTEITLCANTMPIQHLHCTEINVRSENGILMNEDEAKLLICDLSSLAETDTHGQTVFLLEKRKDTITFLVFSIENANLDFLDGVLRLVEHHTGSVPTVNIRHHTNFEEYHRYRVFDKVVDEFLKVCALSGLSAAEIKCVDFLQKCDTQMLQGFSRFLKENYAVTPENNSVDSIRRAIATLTDNLIGNQSRVYLVRSAREYINSNYSNPSISLNSAAETLAVSSGYLSRIFKDKTGQNFSEYLQFVRMDHAKKLLKTTQLSINAVAERVGYSNSTYFRTAFKSRFGITPRQFRFN